MVHQITYQLLKHKGENRIAVLFKYDALLHARIKNVNGSKWSQGKKCWHIPDTVENRVKCKLQPTNNTEQINNKHQPAFSKDEMPQSLYKLHTPEAHFATTRLTTTIMVTAEKPVIILKPLQHRNGEHIGLYFDFLPVLTQAVKQIKTIKQSFTHGCWYLPCTRNNYQLVVEAASHLATIDTSSLKEYLFQKQALVTDVQKPLHNSTLTIIKNYPLCSHNLKSIIAYRNLLVVMKYSPKTITHYCNAFHQLLRLLGPVHIDTLTKEKIMSYMFWLANNKQYSETNLNTTINALKFYFEKVLGRSKEYYDLPRPRTTHKLPDVLAGEEIITLLKNIKNVKHHALIMTSYSAGLRVSDLVGLQLTDIDSKRMMIHVRDGKGKKDRFVPLSVKVLEVLRSYFKVYKPQKYLFEGQRGQPYSTRSAQEIMAAAKKLAGIRKPGSTHMLRHSFATHHLENGTDIRYIQAMLGHNNIQTTMRYTHVAVKTIAKIQSPLDRLQL